MNDHNLKQLAEQIKGWGAELGFAGTAISDIDLSDCESRLVQWLTANFQGEMKYMSAHGTKRSRPEELIPGTVRVITVRLDYLNEEMEQAEDTLSQPDLAYISRYALGRDYHKVIRNRLQKLADRTEAVVGKFGYRAFCDSAPVMEKPLAEKSGHGWIGKHTNLINRKQGSWFFLGELYTDMPLPVDQPASAHCGSCRACMDICPTDAIIAPYQLDARRCISYLTIELHGSIPVEFRNAIGNRIYGCDDCQLVCPWNRYAKLTVEPDFKSRHGLEKTSLVELFGWSEQTFLRNTEGSAIRRIGYFRWLRNIAIALGNAPRSRVVVESLDKMRDHPSEIVREHVAWALEQHRHDTDSSER
jgi:epoxyqueuosine reductase